MSVPTFKQLVTQTALTDLWKRYEELIHGEAVYARGLDEYQVYKFHERIRECQVMFSGKEEEIVEGLTRLSTPQRYRCLVCGMERPLGVICPGRRCQKTPEERAEQYRKDKLNAVEFGIQWWDDGPKAKR